MRDGKRYRKTVHRMVAKTFCIRRRSEQNIVDHIDNDPYNNEAVNLRWVTQSENIQRAYDQGRKQRNQGTTNGQSKLTEKNIKDIRKLLESDMQRKDIAKRFCISVSHLRDIRTRKRWSHI